MAFMVSKGVRLVNNLVLMKRKIFCFDFNGIKKNLNLRVKKKPIYNWKNTKSSNGNVYRK